MNKNDGRPSQSPLACDMTAIPLTERETHLNTSRILFSDIKKIRELPDGYEFRLEDDASVLLGLLCASSAFFASPRWSKYVSRGNTPERPPQRRKRSRGSAETSLNSIPVNLVIEYPPHDCTDTNVFVRINLSLNSC